MIAEVAKENNIRPSRPLSLSALASMTAIVASPVSAAVVYFSSLLDQTGSGLDYLDVLAVTMPATLIGVLLAAAVMLVIDKWRGVTELSGFDGWTEEEVARIRARTVAPEQITGRAKLSVWIFLVSLVLIIAYAMSISDKIGLIKNPVMGRDQAIIAIMLAAGALIAAVCRVDIAKVLDTSTFKSGGSSYVCCLGVAWLGTTFINWNQETILDASSGLLSRAPWMLAVILVIASTLLWSQAATSKALMPLALTLVPASAAVASFPAVAGFFLLPTYMTVVGAVAIDDTGTTRIGKYVFNHSFIVPGAINMAFTIALGFLFSSLLLR